VNIELVWTREGCHLTHIGDDITELVGWTAAELKTTAVKSLVSPASWNFLKENYYAGPISSIVPHSFPIHLLHRDGHEICCHVVVICRYDERGQLAEAWGVLQHCQDQCNLNCLLEWWPHAEPSELAVFNEMVGLAAA